MHGAQMIRKTKAPTIGKIKQAIENAKGAALATARATIKGEIEDVGTGHTILKRRETPIQRLLADKRIGPAEIMAAEDIDRALLALTGALFCKSPSLERRDRSTATSEPDKTIDAIRRYKEFAAVWSKRAKHGDPTLSIIVAALDGRPFREIEIDLRLRNGSASKATAAGLRDYAARAGWATGTASASWLVENGSVFRLRRVRPIVTLSGLARRWDRVSGTAA